MPDLAGLVVFKSSASGASAMGFDDHEPPRAWSGDDLRARERAERAAAELAQSPAARHIHQELAQHYAELAKDAG